MIDTFYPQVGVATVNLLRRLGVEVKFPMGQTCCGQPAYNGGYHKEAEVIARKFVELFKGQQYIVVPSGSCAAMIKHQIPYLLRGDEDLHAQAISLAQQTYELTDFLINVLQKKYVGARFSGKVTYHASCHLLRELGISTEPLQLIGNVSESEFVELEDHDVCCGFGGLFSVKHPKISGAMLEDKLQAIDRAGVDAVIANDVGCLMHMGGAMRRKGMRTRPMHIAELLANQEGRVTW